MSARAVIATTPLQGATTRTERRTPISATDLALGLRMLADLIDAGLPVTRALGAMDAVSPNGWHRAIPSLERSLQEGQSLSAGLNDAPIAVPPLVVGIIAAGEAGHGLAAAVRRAAELTETSAESRARVRAALAYPMVLAISGTMAVGLMVGVVLPRFGAVLAQLDRPLPQSTRLLLDTTSALRSVSLPAFVALLAFVAVVRAWTATTSGRRQWHALLLRLPVLGKVRFAMASARVSWTLAALLDAGVTIRRAIPFAARASGDAEVETRLLAASARVTTGESATQAFARTGALTPLALRLAAAGEQSGRFAGMLVHAATLEQARAERVVRTVVRLLEPAVVLLFAVVVGVIAAALLQAVYSVRPT